MPLENRVIRSSAIRVLKAAQQQEIQNDIIQSWESFETFRNLLILIEVHSVPPKMKFPFRQIKEISPILVLKHLNELKKTI